MNINSAANSNLLGMQPLQNPLMNSPDKMASTSQSLASSAQARSQEAAAMARETQTQQRVEAKNQNQAITSANTAYEQYLKTGRLDTYA